MPPTRSRSTSDIEQLLEAGRHAHRGGALDKAFDRYRRVLDQSPEHPDALYLTGLILYRQNQAVPAIRLIEQATIVDPLHALAHASLAQIYQDQAAHKRAVMYFRRATELGQQNPDILNGLGLSLAKLGKYALALEAFSHALSLKPEMAEAHNNLGNLMRTMGRTEAAQRHYSRCLELRPDFALAHNNLGVLHQAQQGSTRALEHFTAALKINPEYAEAHNNLGALLLDQNQLEGALSEFKLASKLHPNFAQAMINAAMALQNLGLHAQASEQLEPVLIPGPHQLTARWLRCITELHGVYDSTEMLDRARQHYATRLRSLTEQSDTKSAFSLAAGVAMQAYLLPYQGQDDLLLQSMAGDFLCACAEAEQPEPLMRPSPKNGRIRLGLVSAFFYDHSNWKIPIQGWIKGLSRKFEVYAYHTGGREDAATVEARKGVTKFHSGLSVQQFARQILDDNIDVLIYPEVGMHPLTTRLAIQRLAPVQCASWGHPVSTGLPCMDYFISSDLMEPEGAQAYYREKLIRLPGLSFCWTRPGYAERKSFSLSDFGLMGSGPVYLCVQNLSKYLPQHDYLLVEIARQLPSAQLVFIEAVPATSQALKNRLRRCFNAAGLDFEKQVRFLPRQNKERYHALNQLADVFLDTLAWSACNSSLEALVCDLPVVTLPGQFMRSRHTQAFYCQMEYPALIARDEAHYIELAVRLGSDKIWRAAQCEQISRCRHRLEGDMASVEALATLIPTLLESANHDVIV